MMKGFLFLLLFAPCAGFAQQKINNSDVWHLTIADEVTARGIAKVTISINKKQYAADRHGFIIIKKNLIGPGDSIYLSSIGYKPQVFTIGKDYQFPDTIRLAALSIALKEVKVGLIKPAEPRLGIFKEKYNTNRITSPGCAYAQFIPNPNKIKGTVSTVEFGLNDVLHAIEKSFRVRLFLKAKNSPTLDSELTSDTIIVYNAEKKRRVSVDILKYDIQLPEVGVIAVMETLSADAYGKDSVWYNGRRHQKVPGIDMELKRKGRYLSNASDKRDRNGAYSMVGPPADRWNDDGLYDQWYVYNDGNNFAISITVRPE